MVNLISRLCGKIDPLSIDDYTKNGGFDGLNKALFEMSPYEVIETIKSSNLKGRGGAAFPSGLKLQLAASESESTKYIICNADEGEPGTFKDKVLLEGCPFQILEGMAIAAYAAGASNGYVYIRDEYPMARKIMKEAIRVLTKAGYLGDNILGQDFNFNVELRSGAGAYVCGEETALIESIEGSDGRARFKPPYPPSRGLWGKPTVVNNVETLANIPVILSIGANEFKRYGTPSSTGTKLISISGIVSESGVYEVEFGTSLREIVYDICGGLQEGRKLKFLQVGGSSGVCVPESMLDIKLDFDGMKKLGLSPGSGALYAADESVCVIDYARETMKFFNEESCGKCTPCREGSRHIISILDRISKGNGNEGDLRLLEEIAGVMKNASLCGLGQAAPTVVTSTMKYFGDEYMEHIKKHCRAHICSMDGGNLQ